MILELQTTSFLWLFQLDDSKSLHKKWLFHQTSIKKWLFRVPGLYVEHDLWCVCLFSYHKNNWSKKTELVQDHFICWVVPLPSSSQDHWRYHLQNKWWFLWSLLLERGTKPYGNIFFAGRVFVLEINKCDTVGFAFWNFQPPQSETGQGIFFLNKHWQLFALKSALFLKRKEARHGKMLVVETVGFLLGWLQFVNLSSREHQFETRWYDFGEIYY